MISQGRRVVLTLAALAFVLLVTWADYESGYNLRLWTLCIAPVTYIAWACGRGPGMLVAAVASIGMFTTENRLELPPDTVYELWNSLAATVVFVAAAHASNLLHTLMRDQRQRIQELKRLHASLEASRQRLAMAQAVAGLGVCEWRPEAMEVSLSPELASLLGCEPGQALSLDLFLDRVKAPSRDAVSTILRDTAQGDTAYDGEIVIQDELGGDVTLRVKTRRFEEDGSPGVVLVTQDVTEQKLIERLREDAERMTRHDLKNPLVGVINLPKLMLGDDNLTHRQREMLEVVVEAGQRMLRMLDLSLELFKMERGKQVSGSTLVDPAGLARPARAELLPLARSRKLDIVLRLGPGALPDDCAIPVPGDETLCHSMLMNLLRNAVEASPPDETVDVALDHDNGFATVSIHNQGVVPADVRGRFFEKYATSGKGQGTGLGTYSARLIAEAHRGDIAMRTSEAEGACVTVRLPLRKPS